MDRRHFLQAGGALALNFSPIPKAFSQTTWTPPYTLPAAGQAVSLSIGGQSTLLSVATAANGWGRYTSSSLAVPIYGGYGFGAFAEDYSAAGAMVIAGVGGHHKGGIWGGFIFDFATGQWISKANTNGKAETPEDPVRASVDWTTGELLDKTGISGQLPIPAEGYLWHFSPPKAIGGGTKGYLIKAAVVSAADDGWDASRSFKFDLDTGFWTYASDNNIDFDNTYLNPYTDGGGAWDPATGRFYSPQGAAASGYLRYLEKTATGWTWRRVACPNIRSTTLSTVFVQGRDLVIGYMDTTWQRVNLDNTVAGANDFTMTNASLASGYFYTRWHRYPSDGCWYALRGTADRSTITSWLNDGSPPSTLAAEQALLKINPTTWTMSRVPISGGILALWESVYDATPPHGNAFVYVPALQCFAWFPRHDGPVQLIKPLLSTSSGGDTLAPAVPANVRLTASTATSITWAWDASGDNGGGSVAGYKVALYLGDTPLSAPVDLGNVTSYMASGLNANTTYKLQVAAYDNATPANTSAFSAPATGTSAPTGDTSAPNVPTNLTVSGTTATSISWRWAASSDNGGGSVAGYRVTLFDGSGTQVGVTENVGNRVEYTASGLNANTTYKLQVAAYDNASPSNTSTWSAAVAGTTSSDGGGAANPPTGGGGGALSPLALAALAGALAAAAKLRED